MLAVMRDQDYTADDLPRYGVHEQPALVSRTHRQLRTTLLGVLVAAVGLVAALLALLLYPDIDGEHAGRGWILGLVGCAAVMVILALWQHLSWRRASEVWHGDRDDDLGVVVAVSWILHLVSYAVVVLAVVCTAGAFMVMFALIAEAGPARMTLITYVNPAVAVLLGALILDEPITTGLLLGFPLIILGSVLGTWRNAPPPEATGLDSQSSVSSEP